MSLTQDIANMVQAANNLTDEVAGKMGQIDSRVNQAEQEFDQFRTDIQQYIPLPLNLFSNSMMRSVEAEGHPTDYTFTGCTLEAVHPWTKGFEGCYTELPPQSAAPTPDAASEANPYWYGRYNLGSRMIRGGLAGGWGGISTGKILKVTSTAANSSKFFRIPVKTFGVFPRLGLRFWLKVVKGSISFGNDAGLWSGSYNRLPNKISKADADKGKDGWLKVDMTVGMSQATAVAGNVLNFGLPHDEDTELYIALPFLYVPMAGNAMTVAAGETDASPIFTPGS